MTIGCVAGSACRTTLARIPGLAGAAGGLLGVRSAARLRRGLDGAVCQSGKCWAAGFVVRRRAGAVLAVAVRLGVRRGGEPSAASSVSASRTGRLAGRVGGFCGFCGRP